MEIKDPRGVKRAHLLLREGRRVERRMADGTREPVRPLAAALLWDESFLWGLFCLAALEGLGFSFLPVRARDIREGCLADFHLLVAPGGFASGKWEALGQEGRAAVKGFVEEGGGYLGFCGGAGLGLDVEEGLGLLPAERRPGPGRLPNISGGVMVRPGGEGHPLWAGLRPPSEVKVWWPSQFEVLDPRGVEVAARYGEPAGDLYAADVPVSQIEDAGQGFEELEQAYGINLDPGRIAGEPAVLAGPFGRGMVALSYPHLDTPGDGPWAVMLFNLWQYAGRRGGPKPFFSSPEEAGAAPPDGEAAALARGLFDEVRNLVALGEGLGLWGFRSPWLMGWKRGVRGFEFNVLYVMLRELASLLEKGGAPGARRVLADAGETLRGFFGDAREVISSGDKEGFRELLGPFPAREGRYMDAVRGLDSLIFRLVRPGAWENLVDKHHKF